MFSWYPCLLCWSLDRSGSGCSNFFLKGDTSIVVNSQTLASSEALLEAHENGFAINDDMNKTEDIDEVMEKARQLLGGSISHFAFVPTSKTMIHLTDPNAKELMESFPAQVHINVLSSLHIYKLLHGDLVPSKGAIVAVSTYTLQIANFCCPAYGVALSLIHI